MSADRQSAGVAGVQGQRAMVQPLQKAIDAFGGDDDAPELSSARQILTAHLH